MPGDGMPESYRLRIVTLVQGGLFLSLLLLLLTFEHSGRFIIGGAAFTLLIGFHFYIDRDFRTLVNESPQRGVLSVVLYLLLCTLVVWFTRGEEESPLWIVFFLPIVVGASYFGFRGTLITCGAALLLFISHLPPRMYLQHQARVEEFPELLGFGVMFFLVGILIQDFAQQNRLQLNRTQQLNEQLLKNQKHLKQSLEQLETAEKTLKAKEKMASLGELSAGIAHEIRNPLGIISSSAQMLDTEFADQNARQLLDIIQEEATRLNGLITDFLFFGRQLEPQLCDCDLPVLIARDIESLRPIADEKGVGLTFDNRSKQSVERVDPAMIQQVLLNLLLNALEATESGGQVSILLRSEDTGFSIAVSDTGCGIPPENRDKVFDPFFTTKGNGTGLGLANSYKIIQSHGGELTLTSTVGQGSTFTLTLP